MKSTLEFIKLIKDIVITIGMIIIVYVLLCRIP